MKISVVVPTGGRWPLLAQCLASVLAQDRLPDEIIVIDNSLAGTPSPAGLPAEVRLARESRRGVVHARNRGLDEARGEIVAFLDDDCLASPGWLGALEACFDDPAVAAAGGPARALWLAPPPRVLLRSPRILSYFGINDFGSKRKSLSVPREDLMGGNLAIRKAALAPGQRFVEIFPFPGAGQCAEDTQMVRSLAARHLVLYEPAAWVQHQISPHKVRWSSLALRVFCIEAAVARLSAPPRHDPRRRRSLLDRALGGGFELVKSAGRLFARPHVA